MKAIFSYWQTGNHFFCNKEMARLSHETIKKLGYKTCLYTDEIGYNLLSSINYDEVIIFDAKLLEYFNPKIWSLGKIFAMSLVNEPFIHLDFDFFLFKKLDEELAQKDFFSLYYEPWIESHLELDAKNIYETLSPFINNANTNNFKSYNFSIVGGQKFEKINDVCKDIINFAILHNKNIDKVKIVKTWGPAVLFEQVLIPDLLLNKHNIKTETIFPEYHDIKDTKNSLDKFKPILMEHFIKHKMIHLHGKKGEKLNIIKNYLI